MIYRKTVRKVLLFCLLIIGAMSPLYAQSGYTENLGQWNEEVAFRKDVFGAIVYLKASSISILQYDDEAWAKLVQHPHEHDRRLFKFKDDIHRVKYHHYEVEFVGANDGLHPVGRNAKSHYFNFFIGDDASKYAGHVHEYEDVVYSEVYNGIDVVVHGRSTGLKYDFVLREGANLADVKIAYNHVQQVAKIGDSIAITTSLGTFYEHIPVAHIKRNGVLEEVEINYTFENGVLGFEFRNPKKFDELIIDPVVVFATYAGNSVDNFGFTATYDTSGHLYSGGIATSPDMQWNSNGRYPTTNGAFDQTYNGGGVVGDYFFPCDITLNKYAPDGTSLIFATYLGGQSNEYPHSIVVDKHDQLIVFGTTFSINYPSTTNAFQKFNNGASDIILTKFTSDGAALIGSTYIGGLAKDGLNEENILNFFYADNFRGEVIVDSNDIIYAVSSTVSSDFPTKNAFQNSLRGRQDGVVLSMNSDLSQMLWSTYLGGRDGDALYSVDLDSSGLLYVSGGTKSNDLPSATGKIGSKFKGGTSDGFIAILDPFKQSLIKTAYWGGTSYDQIFHLEIDFENKIYVVGQSLSDMPLIGKVYNNPNSCQFISRFDQNLDVVELSTVFGTGEGTPDITINAFLVDECRKIFVSGWGGKTSNRNYSSTYHLPITSDAYQDTTDGSDFYLMVLSKNARELLYGTYFGGNRTNDHVDGGTSRFDKKGVIYQSVCASCPANDWTHAISDFPTTPGAYAEKNVSPRCSNASFKIAFGNLNRPPELTDKVLRMTALDTLYTTYSIHDPDDDSLFVTLTPESRLAGLLVQFQGQSKALETWTQKIGITAKCENVGDTLLIDVFAIDQGCPAVKDSTATIRVIVGPPPILIPPESICLNFIGDNAVQLSWDPIKPSKYFGKMTLYRTDPSGKTEVMATYTNVNANSFTDYDVVSPKLRNYVYFLVVTNACDKDGPKSYSVSTTKEFTFPIEVTYVTTATVNDENNVSVHWAASTEEDFGYYDVYKKKNSDKDDYEYLGSTYSRSDTFFVDKHVQVNAQSYCYAIVVNDNCGHVSRKSNVGCTIVLDGTTEPFIHELYWGEYEEWERGVDRYVLTRSVDTGSLRPIVSTSFDTRYYQDTSFDFCWGGYWYRIKAYENTGGYNAISESNKIYLVQPPLLHVPNAFTPNGDGLNEAWGIVPVFVKEYHLQVFDRWGERVYDSNDVKTDWDGFYRNLQASNTVYIYTIRFTGWDRSVHHRKGTVTVLK